MLEKRNGSENRKTNETNLETRDASDWGKPRRSRFRWNHKICAMGTRRIWTSRRRIEKWTKFKCGCGEHQRRLGTKKRRST